MVNYKTTLFSTTHCTRGKWNVQWQTQTKWDYRKSHFKSVSYCSAAAFNLYIQIIFTEITGAGVASCHSKVSLTQNSLLQVCRSGVCVLHVSSLLGALRLTLVEVELKEHRIQNAGGSQDTEYSVARIKSVLHTRLYRGSAGMEERSALQTLSKAKNTWYLKHTSDMHFKAFSRSFPIWCRACTISAAIANSISQAALRFWRGQLESRADGNFDIRLGSGFESLRAIFALRLWGISHMAQECTWKPLSSEGLTSALHVCATH